MAFPYLSECGFEDGTKGHFDVESDSASRLDFAHYADLAAIPGLGMPWRGAYAMRVDLAKSVTDAYVQETGAWDLSASGSIYFHVMFWVSPDITMANADEFAILQLWSGTNTAEGGAYINYTTANGLRVGIGETAATSFASLSTGCWHCLEVKFVIDSGAGNDGTIDAWLDGGALTQVTALDQAAITSGVLGVVGQDAGTTKGVVLFDDVITDDARLYNPTIRWTQAMYLTLSGHAFVGPGCLENVSLMSGAGTDNVLTVYDTDTGNTNDVDRIRVELKNTANAELVDPAGMPVTVQRGCYVVMSGTNPRALVKFHATQCFGSEGSIRTYAARRRPTAGNV